MTKNALIYIAAASLMLSACSSGPESDPTYVSPNHYSDYNCDQIKSEKKRLSSKLDSSTTPAEYSAATQLLGTAIAAFAISEGFAPEEDRQGIAIERMQNQYNVLEETAIKNKCEF